MKKILLLTVTILIIQTLKSQIPSYVPTSGLVGWWPFSGNALDLSGNGNNGTVLGSTLTSDRYSTSNNAYQFDSTEINCGSSSIFDLNNFTISAWVNTDTLNNTYQSLVVKYDSSPNGSYGLYLFRNKLNIFFHTGPLTLDYFELNSSVSILANQWYHFVATHDSINGVNLYINGVLDASVDSTLNVYPVPSDTLRIGSKALTYLSL